MLLYLAIELHLRVLVKLHIMNEQEFHVAELSYRDWESGEGGGVIGKQSPSSKTSRMGQ